jgi:hypothetical protein
VLDASLWVMSATLYDPRQRATAAQLQTRYGPHWVIWWGPGSRRYWAVPTWPGATVTVVDGQTPNDLTAAIYQAETSAPPARTPAGTGNTPAPAGTVLASPPVTELAITPTAELAAARL